MIIRHKHKNRYVAIPNGIFRDPRLTAAAMGVVGYLLSLPPSWVVRHDQLQRALGLGRKQLESALQALIAAGYVTRDEIQGRDERNRFTTLNYVVSDIPHNNMSDAPLPHRAKPLRKRSTGNNKDVIKTDFTNPFPKSLPAADAKPKQARQKQYSEFGQRAAATGQCAVFVGSEPHKAWLRFRGEDGMPRFIDKVIIDGRVRDIVWMQTLYPPLGNPAKSDE